MTREEGKSLVRTLSNGIAEYATKYGIKNLVLGLSGGIDSTLCAGLCWLAVRKARSEGHGLNLIGVSLPCKSNQEDEVSIATLSGSFCDNFYEKNLEHLYLETLEACQNRYFEDTNISKGNIKARLRMLYLYNLASISRGIVIDTDNLTEHYLGFWTLHGDEGDLNPIGLFWKTEVYELAESLIECLLEISREECVPIDDTLAGKTVNLSNTTMNRANMITALQHAIKITPTDGNGVAAGGDLAQIAPGKTYSDVDEILQQVVYYIPKNEIRDKEERHSHKKLTDVYLKHGEETVDRVIDRMLGSEYKRMHRPLVLTLDGVAMENDSFEKILRRENKI